jgi:hypothetical protein
MTKAEMILVLISAVMLGVDLIALYFLVAIWRDDRAMRIAAEESLKAQLEYLGLRRRWYEQRSRKKEEKAVKDEKPVDNNLVSDVNRDLPAVVPESKEA